jgi:hypothetical protein
MITSNTKNSQKKGQKTGKSGGRWGPRGSASHGKTRFFDIFRVFFMMAISAKKFSTLTTPMEKSSKSTSIICTERVFLYPADQNTKENGVKWGFRRRRKKFVFKQCKWREWREWQTKTCMAWQRKKGQKWPKNGGPKRVKNGQKWGSKKGSKKGQKSTFPRFEKIHERK